MSGGWRTLAAAARIEGDRFRAALAEPALAQAHQLARIVADNRDTDFGRRQGFATIRNADDYRARVPVETHADRGADIERIAAGDPAVRTAAPVIACEETGGSSAGVKLVPYTAPALAAIRAGVLAWLDDLLSHRPGIVSGRGYFAISPATRVARTTPSGLPIGLPDAAYLGAELGAAFLAVSVVPTDVGALRDVTAWRRATLVHLLAADDLAFVSVWSPTFFTGLLDAAREVWAELAPDVARRAGPARTSLVAEALRHETADWRSVWPRLDCVSAWTDAASALPARRLAALLPHAWLQGKGLLATEGVMTVPLVDAAHPVPALTSAFIELVEDGAPGARGVSRLLHEAEPGGLYRVLLTTPGGFYRYDIGDLVRCAGYRGRVPMLAFAGRAGHVCDLVGEKLTEAFVAPRLPAEARLAMLLAAGSGYCLLVDARDGDRAAAWAADLDARLADNPQYAYARRIGQLLPVFPVTLVDAEGWLSRMALARNRRLGDVKPLALAADPSLVADLIRAANGVR